MPTAMPGLSAPRSSIAPSAPKPSLVSEAEARELLLEAEEEAAAEEAEEEAEEDGDDEEAAAAAEALELDAPPVEALVSSGRARLATGSSPFVSPSIAGCCRAAGCFWVLLLRMASVLGVLVFRLLSRTNPASFDAILAVLPSVVRPPTAVPGRAEEPSERNDQWNEQCIS